VSYQKAYVLSKISFFEVTFVPVVIVEMWEGRTTEQKEKLIQGITRAFGEIGLKPEVVHVIIHDTPKANWGVGGKQASKMAP
jgi:4-oxalocrotonate tautomerase